MNGFRHLHTVCCLIFILMPTLNEASKVKKMKKCLLSEWINFKEDGDYYGGNLIHKAEDVDDANKCFMLCAQNEDCETINYNTITHVCELREGRSTIGKLLIGMTLK